MKFICTRFLAIFMLMSVAFVANAQDWTKQKSSLYYIGAEGKVYIEPDYNSLAIYFKNDVVSKTTSDKFNREVSSLKSASETETFEVYVMDKKGMIRVKSSNSMKSTNTIDERQSFLKSYNLISEGAYDVLPSFKIDDLQGILYKACYNSFKRRCILR